MPGFFSNPEWAWPSLSHHQLLTAALHPDAARSLAAARSWLNENDIDVAPFRDHRLLIAIVARHGNALSAHSEYPRLVGLQRMLWTRAQMAMREALPPMGQIRTAGIPVMLLKGTARTAAWPEDQKARASWDIDILVPPSELEAAFDILIRHDWIPSSGESALALRARLPQTRAINLHFGRFGDLDLHQRGYPDGPGQTASDARLWSRARPVRMVELDLLVPAPTDQMALAILSGGRDAHSHSDWLVDCARLLERDEIDWSGLATVLGDHGALIPAEIALGYLRDGLGLPVPELPGIDGATSRASAVTRLSELLQAKPRAAWTPQVRAARAVAKAHRMQLEKRHGERIRRTRGRLRKLTLQDDRTDVATIAPIDLASRRFDLRLRFRANGLRRRYEFELNGAERHLTRLTVRDLIGRDSWVEAHFVGVLPVDSPHRMEIVARPGKALRETDAPEERDRYEAVPFAVVEVGKRGDRRR